MKVLIFGPSGAGKTYVSQALQNRGINAFDGDDIKGLSAWYDQHGNKVPPPQTADEAILNHYSFLWSRKFLENLLSNFYEVYIFGGAGNIFNLFHLFDKIYFLKVPAALQIERLQHPSRQTPLLDRNENGLVTWGNWLEEEAAKKGIPFIDAALTPEQIYSIISQ